METRIVEPQGIRDAALVIRRKTADQWMADEMRAKYLFTSTEDGEREGVGVVLATTDAEWLPAGHLVLAIVAEYDSSTKQWLEARNPC